MPGTTRRTFFARAGMLAAGVSLAPLALLVESAVSAETVFPPDVLVDPRMLSASEQRFIHAVANALCPGDHLTPEGTASALADAMAFCVADPAFDETRSEFTRGIAAAAAACERRIGRPFDRLDTGTAREFLRDVGRGDVPAALPLDAWWSEVVHPLVTRSCFSEPVYGRFGSRVFYKLFA